MLWFLCVRVITDGWPPWLQQKTRGGGREGLYMKLINCIIHLQTTTIKKLKLEEHKIPQDVNNTVNLEKKPRKYNRIFTILCNEIWNETMKIFYITQRFADYLKAKNLKVAEFKDSFLWHKDKYTKFANLWCAGWVSQVHTQCILSGRGDILARNWENNSFRKIRLWGKHFENWCWELFPLSCDFNAKMKHVRATYTDSHSHSLQN